jgi:alkaline phosphatase D
MTQHNASRRQFVRNLGFGLASTGAGLSLSGCDDGQTIEFLHGVASGDPLVDRVMLWTRVTASEDKDVTLAWEIASDNDFKQIVGSGKTSTGADRDHTVKVDATGLKADQTYYYRFKRGDVVSPVGRTRTLPDGHVDSVKIAVFSCSNYPAGYFHAYAEVAKRDDIHVALHLGDYIYEYGRGEYASEDAATLGREVLPTGELISLADYRARYAQYHTDPDLQAVHAALPFICVWDDHEIANDAYLGGAENHDPATEGDYALRRAAALQAYLEWLPIRSPDPDNLLETYRAFDFGDLARLHMLDTRHIGRAKPLTYANYMNTNGDFDSAAFTADLTAADRQLLGQPQVAWLQANLAASTATWQVLGQQVIMGRMNLPIPLLTPDPQNPTVSFGEYATIATAFITYQTLAAQLTASGQALTAQNLIAAGMPAEQLTIVNDPVMQAIIQAPSIPYNLDAWDGYFVARETVLGMARALDKNLVVLSGDSHNAWANDLDDVSGNPVGVEFAGTSVSSPGLEEYLPNEDPATLSAGAMRLISTLKYANTYQRGWLLVSLSHDTTRADWYFVDSVKTKTYTQTLGHSLKTLPGAGNRRLIAV